MIEKGKIMGQIANQMLLEWCHKMLQKIGTREKENSTEKITSSKKNSQGEKSV